MKVERVIIILTGLLALVGVFVLINRSFQDDTVYDDAVSYQEARSRGDLPFGAPSLPDCATDILVARGVDGVESVAFDCEDTVAQEAFIEEVMRGQKWDVMTFNDVRLSLTRIEDE